MWRRIFQLDEIMVPANKSNVTDAPLAQERKFFDDHREQLLKEHRGKFALIKGDEFIGAFDSDENAYTEGVERFGSSPFLVRRIEETDPTAAFPALTFGLLRAHP